MKKKKNQKNEKTKRKTSWDVDYGSLVEALFVYYTDIRTNEEEEDDRQAEAAGVAEGYLTSFLVTKYYEGSYCISKLKFRVKKQYTFVRDNFNFTKLVFI